MERPDPVNRIVSTDSEVISCLPQRELVEIVHVVQACDSRKVSVQRRVRPRSGRRAPRRALLARGGAGRADL